MPSLRTRMAYDRTALVAVSGAVVVAQAAAVAAQASANAAASGLVIVAERTTTARQFLADN